MVEEQGHDYVHHGDCDRSRGEVGQCQIGVKGIVKDKGRGEKIRCQKNVAKPEAAY